MTNKDDSDEMAKVMGFGSFGGTKKAKQFDFMAMFEETRKNAIERNEKVLTERQGPLESTNTKQPKTSSVPKGPSMPPPAQQSKPPDTEDSDEDIGPAPPPNYGAEEDDDDDMIGPMPPPPGSDDEEEEEDDNPVKKIPSSHEVSLEHGPKTVSALALDPSGARLVTGSIDFDVKFWDFAGMDASLRSFRTVRPCECHQIKSLEYSRTGDNILVVSGNAQAKVLDRDGHEVIECVKGDQYIVDQSSTKGHTAMLNAGCWHPKDKDLFATCSNDGTVRIWRVDSKTHLHCMKPKNRQGRKTVPTAITYSRDAKYIAAGSQDGSIQMWDNTKKFYVNVAIKNMEAHQNGCDISSLCFSYDGKTLASRATDDTLKLWDIKSFKKPLHVVRDLENISQMTDCGFSPDDKLVYTGVSVRPGAGYGKILFFDRETMSLVSQIEVVDGVSVIRTLWHPKLNQIVAGCADGSVKIYYDPDKSHRGALLSVVKKKKKKNQHVEMMVAQNIITPHALPLFREARATSTRKADLKNRKDPTKSQRPDLPMTGQGEGGRLGAKGSTLSQYVVQQLVTRKPDEADKDPRGAILRHAKDAAENPYWVDTAYKSTQPKPVFQPEEKSDEEEDPDEPLWKKQKI